MFQHEERAFVLKFSAIEIYNEAIRDLLSADSSPLRLLDDPEVDLFAHFGFDECINETKISNLLLFFPERNCGGESHGRDFEGLEPSTGASFCL